MTERDDTKQSEPALEHLSAALDEHRRMSYPFGMIYWLKDRAHLLLDIVLFARREKNPLPEFLAPLIVPLDEEHALRQALVDAEEGVELSRKLSKGDVFYESRLVAVRIRYAMGETERGLRELRALLDEEGPAAEIAPLHYWIWVLAEGEAWGEEHRTEGLRMYEELAATKQDRFFIDRVAELSVSN